MRILWVLAILGLTACGADGPPIRPALGLSITKDGIKSGANVSTLVGPVSVGVSL